MKSAEPFENTPDPPELDRVVLHSAIKECGGNLVQAHRLLKDNGLTTRDYKWFHKTVTKDPALKAVWIDQTSEYSVAVLPSEMSPAEEQAHSFEMARKEQEFIDSRNMEEIFGEHSKEAMTLARFSEESFGKTINFVHGLAVKSSMTLFKRMEYIADDVLLNDEIVKRKSIAEDGTVIEYDGPKYTEEEKLEWQKELRELAAELRRFADTGNQAALARIRAREIDARMMDGGGNGKSGRGNRPLKQ